MILDWPPELMSAAVAFNRRGTNLTGPRSITGRDQSVASDAGFWVATLGRVAVNRTARVLAHQALAGRLEGGANQVRVPFCAPTQAPWPDSNGPNPPGTFSDGTLFSDGTGFFEPRIFIKLAAAANLRDYQVSVTITTAGTVKKGMRFSLADRMHEITEIVSVSGANQVWRIWPLIRQFRPVDEPLNFDKPLVRMKLREESDADLELALGRFGFPDMNFVESF